MPEVSNEDEVLDRKQILLKALHWAQKAEQWGGGGDMYYGGDPKAAAAISQAWSALAAGLKSEPTEKPLAPVRTPGKPDYGYTLSSIAWNLRQLVDLLEKRLPEKEGEEI